MFSEELEKIKQSETYAKELQKKAKNEAKQSLEQAKTQGEKIVEEAEKRAEEIQRSLIQEGQREAEEQYASFLKAKREECAAVTEKARSNENKAIKMIAERIVKSGGNS